MTLKMKSKTFFGFVNLGKMKQKTRKIEIKTLYSLNVSLSVSIKYVL